MQSLSSPSVLIAVLASWLVACVVMPFARSDLAFGFVYFVLPWSAFIVPIVVGQLAARLYYYTSSPQPTVMPSRFRSIALVFMAGIAYLLCVAVLSRLLEIPWRQAKFGDPVLSLGRSAAQAFVIAALATGTAVLLVLRAVPRASVAARLGVAALGMLAFACLAYVCVGASSLVAWRA